MSGEILNNKGIFHFGSSDKVSRYDFANIIADVFDLDSQLINKVSSEELNFTARRPNNTSLSNSKLNMIQILVMNNGDWRLQEIFMQVFYLNLMLVARVLMS